MKEDKMIEYLKNCNFWGNENFYCYTMEPGKYSKEKNIYGLDFIHIKYYLLNKNENGIGIIPFDFTGKSIKELIKFIPNYDIKEVYVEKYKSLIFISEKRLIIKTKLDEVLEVGYNGKENGNMHNINMHKFFMACKQWHVNNIEKNNSIIINKGKNNYDMIIKVVSKDTNFIAEELYNEIFIIEDKNEKDKIERIYIEKMIDAINKGMQQFYIWTSEIPENKQIAMITAQALSEALFDTWCRFKDDIISSNNFEVVIITPNEITKKFYEKELKKLDLL